MLRKSIFLLSFILVSTSVVAQRPTMRQISGTRTGVETYSADHFVVGEIKGNVSAKAIYLPKPEYPVEARWAGAEGQVRIQITVDNEGNVNRTELLSGDPLLGVAAVDAARRTKFRIARNESGQAIEANGTLTYTFEIRKSGWSAIAYGLSGLDRLPIWTFSIPTARKAMLADWDMERGLIEKLDKIRRAEPPMQKPLVVRIPSSSVPGRFPAGSVSGRSSSSMQGVLAVPGSPGAEQKAYATDLINALKTRLANDELSLWQFKVGIRLRESFEMFRNPNERIKAASNLSELTKNTPAGVSPNVVTALRELESLFEKENRTMQTNSAMTTLLLTIFNGE